MLALGIFKGQRSCTNHKILPFWVDVINLQSFSGHYLSCKQVPVVFLLHLVYFSTAACISEKLNLGPCCRKDF